MGSARGGGRARQNSARAGAKMVGQVWGVAGQRKDGSSQWVGARGLSVVPGIASQPRVGEGGRGRVAEEAADEGGTEPRVWG